MIASLFHTLLGILFLILLLRDDVFSVTEDWHAFVVSMFGPSVYIHVIAYGNIWVYNWLFNFRLIFFNFYSMDDLLVSFPGARLKIQVGSLRIDIFFIRVVRDLIQLGLSQKIILISHNLGKTIYFFLVTRAELLNLLLHLFIIYFLHLLEDAGSLTFARFVFCKVLPDVDVFCILEPDGRVVVLSKLTLHLNDFIIVHLLQIEAHFVNLF